MPAKVHADEVLDEFRVRRDRGPRAEGVLGLLVVVFGARVRGLGGVVAVAEVDEVRGAANVSRGAVFEPQLAHLAAQLALERGARGLHGRRGHGADGLVVVVVAILAGDDGLGDRVEALAGADLVDEVGDGVLGVVEDGLDQRVQRRAARLEVVDVLFVDALAAVVRVGVVDALGVVHGGTGGAAAGQRMLESSTAGLPGGRGAVALSVELARARSRQRRRSPRSQAVLRTLLLRFRQGTQADEMQRRFFDSSLSALRLPRRPFLGGASGARASLAVLRASMAEVAVAVAGDAGCGVTAGRLGRRPADGD